MELHHKLYIEGIEQDILVQKHLLERARRHALNAQRSEDRTVWEADAKFREELLGDFDLLLQNAKENFGT